MVAGSISVTSGEFVAGSVSGAVGMKVQKGVELFANRTLIKDVGILRAILHLPRKQLWNLN